MDKLLEEYKIARNSIQLIDVELMVLNCEKNISVDKEGKGLSLEIKREVGDIDNNKLDAFLHVDIIGPDEIFKIHLILRGICNRGNREITDNQFKEYAHSQIVPLLLPYARECISNTLIRMKLPNFHLPTIDVLETLKANKNHDSQ